MEEGAGGSVPEAAKTRVQEAYGKLPLYFIQNDGQVDERVRFYEKGSGHATFFTKDGVYISLVKDKHVIAIVEDPKQTQQHEKSASPIPSPLRGQGGGEAEFIKLYLLNANPDPEIIAVDQQEGRVNYFIGNDSGKWRTNIPTYRTVVYKEVYPGIDIKFYGNNGQLEYDVIVKPGANPANVRFAYDGIRDLNVA